jgi:heavy metal sensor kinase
MNLRNTLRRSRWGVPVGWQLSALYSLILAATLGLLGLGLYWQLDQFAVQNASDRLQRTAEAVIQRAPARTVNRTRPVAPDALATMLVRDLSGPDVGVVVRDPQGTVLSATQTVATGTARPLPALPADWAAAVAAGAPAEWIVRDATGTRLLIRLAPRAVATGSGQTPISILIEQVASLEAPDALLGQVRLYIGIGILLGSLIGILAGRSLTRIVLRPLEAMVETAEAIAAGDLSRRLRLPVGRNEVARLGQAFDHMVGRLATALESQRRFVADASHELRTPLTSLQVMSEVLLLGADQGDTTTIQRSVHAMYRELGRLTRLVNDLLVLSRLDSSLTPAGMRFDLAELAREVRAQMPPLAAGQALTLAVQAGGPLWIDGDRDRLKQVVLNLVDNALRYTPEGGTITLSARADRPAQAAVLEVADTGVGIPPPDLPHIFDRFYRADRARTRDTGNSGLGLAIAHAIVQAHQGSITAESALGQGTRFVIRLPEGNAARPPAPARRTLEAASPS